MQSNNIFMNNKRITAPTTTTPTNTTTTHRRAAAAAAQACAACKYQRRKCAADCILAPYFPHDRQRQFLNAHRLFGVSNIVKIVRRLDPPLKDAAMRTIIFQSDARAADPVGGCYRIIRDLEQQIDLATAELEIVLHHLDLCRAAAGRQQEEAAPPHPDGGDAKWRENDGNAWICMDGMNVHAHGESSSSSSFNLDHDQDLKIILDNLSREQEDDDDGDDNRYKFGFLDGSLPSNNAILREENATLKEEDENQLNSAAANLTLTNFDEIENIENKF